MRNPEMQKLKKAISKLPIRNRLILLQDYGKNRYNAYYPDNIDYSTKSTQPFNYELEFISLMSIIVDNKERYTRLEGSKKWLHETVNIVRNQKYLTELFESHGAFGAMAGMFFMQMQGQKVYSNLYYRYNYMYNFKNKIVDMNFEFRRKFKLHFNSYLDFCLLISTFKDTESKEPLKWFYNKINCDLKVVFDNLKATRSKFIETFRVVSTQIDEFSFFNLNLLLQFPLIEYIDEVYCPWYPYIPYAITESLMYRLTQNNNDLRTKIGKEVLESYVYHLLDNSVYSAELNKTCEIIYDKQHKHTSDIIISKGEEVLLIEIKFISQSLSLRELNDETIETYSMKLAQGFAQLKKNIDLFEASRFKDEIGIDCTTAKGVLLTYDEYYFHREEIYVNAVNLLSNQGIITNTQDLQKQVLIVSLSNFENILIHIDDDILTYFYNQFKRKNSWVDYIYNYDEYSDDIDGLPIIKEFLDNYTTDFANRIESLIKLP